MPSKTRMEALRRERQFVLICFIDRVQMATYCITILTYRFLIKIRVDSGFFFTTKIDSCQCLVTNNINPFPLNDSFIKLRIPCHRAFTVQEVTVIEK